MRLPGVHRTLIVRLVVICALFSSTFSLSTKAAGDQWAEQFKAPFAARIVNVLDGHLTDPPVPGGAALSTVAGLNDQDPIVIEGDGVPAYEAHITGAPNAETHWVNWYPAGPAPLNGSVRSSYSLLAPKASALDAQGRIYTADTLNNRVVVFDVNGSILWTIGGYGSALGYLAAPRGLDVSADGKTIAVADTDNNRIQIWKENPNGSFLTSKGQAGPKYSAFSIGTFGSQTVAGTPPVGQFDAAFAVGLGANGRIVAVDQNNLRI